MSLGECERTLASREKWRTEAFIQPIPHLRRGWVKAADNGRCEYRLAAALASLGVYFKEDFFPTRRHLEAVRIVPGAKGWVGWDAEAMNEVA